MCVLQVIFTEMATGSDDDLWRNDIIPGTQPTAYDDPEARQAERQAREAEREIEAERERLLREVERERHRFGGGPRRNLEDPFDRDLLHVRRIEKPKVFPAMYDGKTNWTDYEVHFSMVAEINGWDDWSKAVFLASSLRGSAQGVLSDLDERSRHSFRQLRAALARRFGQENQTELFRAQLRLRQKKTDETLPELAQEIRRLVRLAYPTADEVVREALAKEGFLDALVGTDLKWQVVQARPPTLEEATRVAVELEAFIMADKQRVSMKPQRARVADTRLTGEQFRQDECFQLNVQNFKEEATLDALIKQMQRLMKEAEKLSFSKSHRDSQDNQSLKKYREKGDNKRNINCWDCGLHGHVSHECPQRSKDNGEQRDIPTG